jgi:hypothetical protein
MQIDPYLLQPTAISPKVSPGEFYDNTTFKWTLRVLSSCLPLIISKRSIVLR